MFLSWLEIYTGAILHMADRIIKENFNKIWNLYHKEISYFCMTKLLNPAYVEDCIQNVFTALLLKMKKGEEIKNPRAWLYGCAKNQAYKLNQNPKNKRTVYLYDNVNTLEHTKHYDSYFINEISEKEIEMLKNSILRKLKPHERLLLTDVYKHNAKLSNLSNKYNISPNALSHRLVRLRKKIYNYVNEIENKIYNF